MEKISERLLPETSVEKPLLTKKKCHFKSPFKDNTKVAMREEGSSKLRHC